MRGENFDGPVLRPSLFAQIAHRVGRLAGETEANGQIAASDSTRVAFQTKGAGNRKIPGESGMETDGRCESSGFEEGAGRVAGSLPVSRTRVVSRVSFDRVRLAHRRVHPGLPHPVRGAGRR